VGFIDKIKNPKLDKHSGPFEMAWWFIVVIIFRPIRWIVNLFRGVKTKKDGSRDKRYKDKDEEDEEDEEDEDK
jgi:hypothetical protein